MSKARTKKQKDENSPEDAVVAELQAIKRLLTMMLVQNGGLSNHQVARVAGIGNNAMNDLLNVSNGAAKQNGKTKKKV